MSVTVTTSTAVVTVTSDVSATVVTSGAASATVNENQAVVASTLIGVDSIQSPTWVQFNTTGVATPAVGRVYWNDTDGTLDLGLKGGNVTLQVGQESVQLVKSATNDGLLNGKVVYLVGSDGNNITASYAIATGEGTSSKTFGVMTETASGGNKGFCTTFGLVRNIDTSGLTEGAIVWLSPSVLGGMTTTKPQAPNHAVMVGLCIRSHANNGVVFVTVNNGLELDELHNVLIDSPADNQVLTYEASTGLWKNKTNTVDGVQSVVFSAPLTGGTVTSAGTVGLDQSALSITRSQVSDFASGTVAYATTAGSATSAGAATTAGSATTAGTASYSTTSGTAVYATTAGTAVGISGSITPSQVAGTAVVTSDSRLSDSRTPTAHASSHASGGSDPVTLAQSQVTNLTTDLAAKAALTASQTFTGTQTLIPASITTAGLIVKAASGQTGNILELQNNAGSAFVSVGAGGAITSTQFIRTTGEVMTGTNSILGQLSAVASTSTRIGAVIRGAASQTANLTEWQDSSGSIYGAVSNVGIIRAFSGFASTTTGLTYLVPNFDTSGFGVSIQGAAQKGLVIRGVASQSANLQEWQDSAGTVLMSVNSAGGLKVGTTLSGYYFHVNNTAYPAVVGAMIRGAASQSANLQEWQNSAGTVLSRVDSAGNIVATNNTSAISSGAFILGTDASGGRLTLVKATSTPANPGANLAKLYFRDGTNAGTLKLVVRAGAAGAETTILDNIPQ